MHPEDLKPEQFSGYPPEARKLALDYLETFRRLPLSFLRSLLQAVIEFDFKFHVVRRHLAKELGNLRSLSHEHLRARLPQSTEITLPESREKLNTMACPA